MMLLFYCSVVLLIFLPNGLSADNNVTNEVLSAKMAEVANTFKKFELAQGTLNNILETQLMAMNSQIKNIAEQGTENQKSFYELKQYLYNKFEQMCPTGYEKYRRSCYKIVAAQVDWSTAMLRCREGGAHLVAMESKGEETFLVNSIRKSIQKHGIFSLSSRFWTGATDQHSEGNWIWQSNGEQIQNGKESYMFTNWSPGHPNNNINMEGTSQDCLIMYIDDPPRWNDVWCANKYNFICERHLV